MIRMIVLTVALMIVLVVAMAFAVLGIPASAAERGVSASPAEVTPVKVLRQVTPAYPPSARSARIEGAVCLAAQISAGGRVKHVRVLKGNRRLAPAAIVAFRQWRFQPATINGEPVQANYAADFTFALD